jgi:hypothetical protein
VPDIHLRSMAEARVATVSRKTNETEIHVDLNLDATPGSGITQVIKVNTGIGFLDHVTVILLPLQPHFLNCLSDVQCFSKTRRMVPNFDLQRRPVD